MHTCMYASDKCMYICTLSICASHIHCQHYFKSTESSKVKDREIASGAIAEGHCRLYSLGLNLGIA